MSRKTYQNSRVVEKTKAVRIIRRKPPEMGQLKLNVDASLFVGENSFSVGMLIRNEVGGFVRGKSMKIQGEVLVLEAEARGIQEALRWVDELGLQGVVIESDSELAVKAMKNETCYYLELGHCLDSCRRQLKHRVDLSLCHVKKQANMGAHLMARVPVSLNCFNIFESPPSLLLETLSTDFSS
ncbi:uncharacterized protein LOC141684272 [Apium graveolens]|uniref:uncharacterized protein LOC141684272 n=1 Tax=Apium graveolens TaxID=4045 RepID=UPI003D7ADF79